MSETIPPEVAIAWWNQIVGGALYAGAVAFAERITEVERSAYIDSADIATAVWADPRSPSGLYVLCFKGYGYCFDIAVSDKKNLVMRSLPVIDRAAAEKLLAKYGDPSWPAQLIDPPKPNLN